MSKKESIYSGIGAGLLFGVIQSISGGLAHGVTAGIFFGVAMGFMLHLFANSKLVKRQTTLPDSVLLPGEKVLVSKLANLVIRPKDFGLDEFAFSGLMWIVGMKKKESLGGALYVTNYRVILKTHRYNRLRGMTSIFLPTIEQLENRTVLVFRKLAVLTNSSMVEFIVAQVDEVIAQIETARANLDEKAVVDLQYYVRAYPEKCSDQLEPWSMFNRINRFFNFGKKATDVTMVFVNPLGMLSSKFTSELLDRTVSDKWQQVLENPEQEERSQLDQQRPAA